MYSFTYLLPSFQVWPHKDYPLIPVGKLVLNRNPLNYFAEVEQLAFDPSNMPPGIEPSPDKMLQVTVSDFLSFLGLFKPRSVSVFVFTETCFTSCVSVQGRLFSYPDTHRHRLGANYLQLPVNCPYRARVANYQRDGPMCFTDNQGKPQFSSTN